MPAICMLGASTTWVPRILTDLQAVFDERLDVRIVDVNEKAAALGAEWGEVATRKRNRNDSFLATTNRRQGLAGADAVIIALHVGGLQAMERDLAIPEKYGIYTTVGDTTGPSGWSRAIRNIPVFREFAQDFAEVCPRALIINYSNPMAALTATLQHTCSNPVVGLCHSYFETRDFIQYLFNLPDQSSISLSIAGMNHFTWVVDFRIGREEGYRLLRDRIDGGSLRDLLQADHTPEGERYAGSELAAELYDAFGYLPYPGDRHIAEFVSFALCGNPERYTKPDAEGEPPREYIRYCNIRRTSIAERRAAIPQREANLRAQISGEKPLPTRSRETGADMIRAYLHNRPLNDAVNVLNVGQIPGLPLGACVETFGVVDGMGVRPVVVPNVPEHLLEIMRPQAVCQKWLTQGVLENDPDLLLQALLRDPQCAHLTTDQVRDMARELAPHAGI
ncbi:MAG: hypothetical protein QHJ73_02515 [Armatimonadota bacterium]|nr:hypothetical protein [Armatimonadota bacterium]